MVREECKDGAWMEEAGGEWVDAWEEECAVASWEEECAGSMTRDSSQGRDQARDKCDKRAGK